jgi:hypothetical protein
LITLVAIRNFSHHESFYFGFLRNRLVDWCVSKLLGLFFKSSPTSFFHGGNQFMHAACLLGIEGEAKEIRYCSKDKAQSLMSKFTQKTPDPVNSNVELSHDVEESKASSPAVETAPKSTWLGWSFWNNEIKEKYRDHKKPHEDEKVIKKISAAYTKVFQSQRVGG